jgi:hypothetical protein
MDTSQLNMSRSCRLWLNSFTSPYTVSTPRPRASRYRYRSTGLAGSSLLPNSWVCARAAGSCRTASRPPTHTQSLQLGHEHPCGPRLAGPEWISHSLSMSRNWRLLSISFTSPYTTRPRSHRTATLLLPVSDVDTSSCLAAFFHCNRQAQLL